MRRKLILPLSLAIFVSIFTVKEPVYAFKLFPWPKKQIEQVEKEDSIINTQKKRYSVKKPCSKGKPCPIKKPGSVKK